MRHGDRAARRLVVAHPSPDLYGSDRQLVESVTAAVDGGWSVLLLLPADGPLAALARDRGARVRVVGFPVLRKSLLHPLRLPGLAVGALVAAVRGARLLRRVRADLVYVNTVTVPWWVLAGRLAGVPVLCHVHEAETDQARLVAVGLNAPLLGADLVVTNSVAAADVARAAVPRLAGRLRVIHNGVPGPDEPPAAPDTVADGPRRLVVVGRLSPRKGTDVALAATARLVARGYDVHLDVAGSVFPGYEWFADELADRAARPDLAGRVDLLGYRHPTWPVLARADVVLVPSRTEPFGNVAVEAMLARRPVVASGVQGLCEVVEDGRTGLLVAPDDPTALADAVQRLFDDPGLAARLADAGLAEARARFGVDRFRDRVRGLLDDLVAPGAQVGGEA